MKNKLAIFVITLLCILTTGALARTGEEHIQQWNDVFGITDSASKENIRALWKTAQEVIDDYEADYRELRKNFGWFTWGSYGHRLLFHWGFNADPKRYAPLVRQVRSCLKDKADSKGQEQKFFAYLTRNIQSRRNKKLINAVTSVTGITTARGYANAIATILYDVHILDDYSTVNLSALPSIESIEHDLMENGFSRLIAGGEKIRKLEEISSELRASIRAGRGRINSKRAELLKESVKNYLPEILNERFKKTLAEKGITITGR